MYSNMYMSVTCTCTLYMHVHVHYTCTQAQTDFFRRDSSQGHRKMRTRTRPRLAVPTSVFTLSAHLFASVVGPLQVWSHHGHEQVGGRRGCRRGRCLSGPVFACAIPVGLCGLESKESSSGRYHKQPLTQMSSSHLVSTKTIHVHVHVCR